MKIVDENGKLFKKFNLVDAIVVFLVLVIIVAIGCKVISSKVAAAEERQEEQMSESFDSAPHLVYDVVCANVPNEVAEHFAQQMELPLADRQIMNGGALLNAYITDCSVEPDADDSDMCKVYFTIEALLVEKEGIASVGAQEVRIGKSHIVKTYNIETSGYVYSMQTTGEVPADE